MQRKPPIGISDFKEVIEGYHYVDKTRFIQEVLDEPAKVLLLPRPRRFGKTLNLSMLRYFFEKTEDNHRLLFEDLEVSSIPEIMEKQGRFPVISLTFKGVNFPTFQECFTEIRRIIVHEFSRHSDLLKPVLSEYELKQLDRFLNHATDTTETAAALQLLSEWLHRASGEKTMLLVDEYDTPIQAAYANNYYEEGVNFIRNLLGAGLKDNPHLEKGVLTGILRVARESIFSGLNNLKVYTILRKRFATSFGFTEQEVESLLKNFSIPEAGWAGIRNWYNGYLFGESVVYNPWSILNYLNEPDEGLNLYWINTSSNDLIREQIIQGSSLLHKNLETLIAGGSIESRLDEYISLREIGASQDAIYSLMVHSGYLKPLQKIRKGSYDFYSLAIPNEEVRLFFESSIRNWLEKSMGDERLSQLLDALTSNNMKMFGNILRELVSEVLSFHDTGGEKPEKVYHAFTLGLLVNLRGRYRVDSNRESGYGRYDVMLIPENKNEPGLILEFKKLQEGEDKNEKDALENAFAQIQDKDYAARLRTEGVNRITAVAVVFAGKRVIVDSRSV